MSAIVFEKVTPQILKLMKKNLQFFWDQAVVVKLLF